MNLRISKLFLSKPFFKLKIIVLLTSIFISSCTTGEKYGKHPIDITIPEKWGVGIESESISLDGWLDDFKNDELKKVVYQALNANPDILIAAERVEYSKKVLGITSADLMPSISGGIKTGRSQSVTVIDDKPVKSTENQSELYLNMSWELDIWGKIRALKNAEFEELLATEFDYRNARMSYAAQTAKAWFSAIKSDLLTRLSKQTLLSFEKSDDILTRRYIAGLSSAMDLRLIRAERLSALDSLMEQERRNSEAVRGLKILMGLYPSDKMDLPDILPHVDKPIPVGLPSEILERRPDIKSAKKRLISADFQIEAAEKSLFPSISLTAGTGTSSKDLKNIASADYTSWSFGGGILMPIFQAGRLKANIKKNSSASKQAWLNYQKTVLNAFSETETAIEAEVILEKQEAILKKIVTESEAALEKAWDLYLVGNTEITSILDSQRSLTNARKSLISISASRLMNRIDLYLALGGSFENMKTEETSRISTLTKEKGPRQNGR